MIPHDVLSGVPARLKAVAGSAALPVSYTWEFGDGSAPETGTADTLAKAYAIETQHVYTGSDGTPYTATISIEDAGGSKSTDSYLVILRDKNLQVEMNIAIDEGLWYLHRIINRTNITPSIRGGNWNDQGYTISATASAVQSFEINGHLPLGDAARDPYIEDVTRGLNHLFTQLVPYSIAAQIYGDPDTNGNGVGLSADAGGRPIYEGGQVVDALVAAGAPDLLAPVGGANVIGRPVKDLVQDLMDQFYWGQYDDADVGGGWRYGWNSFPDNSACQWASIAAIPAHDVLGVPIPQWVKDRNLVWLNYSSSGDGFGYTGRGSGYGTTPSGMVQLAMDDVAVTDVLWKNGENYIARNWADFLNQKNFYGFYAFAKAMRLVKPVPKTTLDLTGLNWFLDPAQGLARKLIDLQFEDGHWRSNQWSTEPLSTAWGVIILSASLFQKPPVAVVHASPNPGAVGQLIHFDGTPSYHLDATKKIVSWQWDFDNRDGVDFEQPDDTGAVVDHAFPSLGSYTVSLRVIDDAQPAQVATTQVEIEITIPPHPPTAVPGGPYLAAVGEPVVLDGTGSFDVDVSFGDKVKSWGWDTKNKQPRDFADAVGATPTIEPYAAAGIYTIGLRVTDDTSTVFPQTGSPDLTNDAFTEVTVYERVIDDLAARAKDDKIQLTWSPNGFADFQVYRSERGPNEGFQKIASTDSQFSTYLDQGIQLNTKYFYRIFAFQAGEPVNPDGISSAAVVISSPRTRNKNHRPKITTAAPLFAAAGDLYRYDVDATDDDGDPLTYLLDQGPPGMAIDGATGVITFTPDDGQVGPHTVFIEVDDTQGGIDTQIYDLVVRPRGNQKPVAKANGPYAALAGDPIQFSSQGSFDPDGDPITVQWAFGDGETSSEANPLHAYAAAGQYVATVFVQDDRGGLGTEGAKVQVDAPNRPPAAVAGPDVSLRLGETLSVDGSGSSDPDGDPLSFTWNFGDSTPAVSGETADHIYGSEGVFQVSLTVTDGRGGMDTAEFTATVGGTNGAPIAMAQGGGFGNVGVDLTFDGTGTSDPEGDPLTFSWDFGDGSTTSGLLVTHRYGTPGDYTATFTARDNHGGVGTATVGAHINAPPVFTTAPATSVLEDALFSYVPQASDADGDPVGFTLVVGPGGMVFDVSGTLLFTAGKADMGDHPVTIRASDGKGGTADQSFTLTVVHVNHAPSIVSSPPVAADQFALYAYDVQAADPDEGDVLTFQLTAAPGGMTVGDTTGQVRWTPGKDDLGPHGVTVVAADGHGGQATQSWTVTVNEVNLPPKITSAAVTSATEHQPYGYQVTADDPNGDTLHWSLSTAPAGMTIGEATGLIAWTPDRAHPPTAGVTVSVSDGRGGTDAQSFTITIANVNDPPVFTSSPVTGAVEGQAYSYQAAATDEDGDAIAFSLLEAPSGMTIGGSSGLVSYTPPAGSSGQTPVRIQADDGHGGKTEQSYTLNVRPENRAPAITSTAPLAAQEDALYGYAVQATDPDGDAITFSLTTAPAGMAIDPATGAITWTPVKKDVGDHPVTVSARDEFGASDSQSFTVSVAAVNHPPTITSTAPLAGDVSVAYSYGAAATDPEGDAITWSLATAPSGMTVDGGTGAVSWTPAAAQLGPNPVSLTATDSHGASSHQDFTVTVVDLQHAPVVKAIPGQTVQDPKPFAVIALDDFAADPDNPASQLTWKVTGQSQLTVTVDAQRKVTIGYAPGTRVTETLTFTATDPDGLTGFAQASFTVAEPSNDKVPPVLLVTVTPGAIALGGTATIDVQATDNEGISGVTASADGQPISLTSLGGGKFRGSYTGVAVGAHTVTAVATDLAGNSFTDSVELLVADPSITGSPTAAITAPADDALIVDPTDVVGSAGGPDFLDWRLEYALNDSGDAFTEIARGSTPVTGAVLGAIDPRTLKNDIYTIRLTARNRGGVEKSVSINVQVQTARQGGALLHLLPRQDAAPRALPAHPPAGVRQPGPLPGRLRLRLADPGERRQGRGEPEALPGLGAAEVRGLHPHLLGGPHPVPHGRPSTSGTSAAGCSSRPSSSRSSSSSSPSTVPGLHVLRARGEHPGHAELERRARLRDHALGRGHRPGGDRQLRRGALPPLRVHLPLARGVRVRLRRRQAGRPALQAHRHLLPRRKRGLAGSERDRAVGRQGPGLHPGRAGPHHPARRPGGEQDHLPVRHPRRPGGGDRRERQHHHVRLRQPARPAGDPRPAGEPGGAERVRRPGPARLHHRRRGQPHRVHPRPRGPAGGLARPAGERDLSSSTTRWDVTRKTDALGGVSTFSYDAHGNMLAETDPVGPTATHTYDARDTVLSGTDFEGDSTAFTYDSGNRVLTFADGRGRTIASVYDSTGNPTQITGGDGSGPEVRLRHGGERPQPDGSPGEGHQLHLRPHREHDLPDRRAGERHELRLRLDEPPHHGEPHPHPRRRVQGASARHRFEFDGSGNATRRVDPLGNAVDIELNGVGKPSGVTDPMGNRTSYLYDALGHVSGLEYPGMARAETFTHDEEGNQTSHTDRDGKTTLCEYDALNRLTRTVNPDGSAAGTTYDAAGRVLTTTDERGNVTGYAYAPHRVTVTDPLGNVTIKEYDQDGPPARAGNRGTSPASRMRAGTSPPTPTTWGRSATATGGRSRSPTPTGPSSPWSTTWPGGSSAPWTPPGWRPSTATTTWAGW